MNVYSTSFCMYVLLSTQHNIMVIMLFGLICRIQTLLDGVSAIHVNSAEKIGDKCDAIPQQREAIVM